MTNRSVDERSRKGEATGATAACDGLCRVRSAAVMAPAAGCVVAVATACLAPLVAFAQERSYDGGWGMHPMWWAWGAGGVVMMVMMLAFWALVIAGLVLGVRWMIHQGPGARPDSALDILRQRYARGEINREEFEAKKRDLS